MGQPAARLGDQTAHGGTIVGPGCPTVLIGGKPAARLTDNHVCPMVTPPGVPHVGGPIVGPGVPTVLIGGMPAACVGDMCTCAGPPDSIVAGCFTVLIGAGGGGGGGGGAAKAAQDSGVSALQAQSTEDTGPHWIEYAFTDKAGNPVSGIKYDFSLPDGSTRKGVMTGDGGVKAGGLPDEGECNVVPYKLFNAKWSKDRANADEQLTLTAEVDGYPGGTPAAITIYGTGSGMDVLVAELEAQTQGTKIQAQWQPPMDESTPLASALYFVVQIGDSKTRSALLQLRSAIELTAKLPNGEVKAGAKYRVHFDNGEVREGVTDSNGHAALDDVPAGDYDVSFPDYAGPYEQTGERT